MREPLTWILATRVGAPWAVADMAYLDAPALDLLLSPELLRELPVSSSRDQAGSPDVYGVASGVGAPRSLDDYDWRQAPGSRIGVIPKRRYGSSYAGGFNEAFSC